MTTYALRFRRGLAVATSFLLTTGTAALALAAPPEDDDGWSDETDADDATPPADDATPPAGGDDDGDDDWGDDDGGDDDWGDDEEDDDWDGQLMIEDVSDDPEAAENEVVEQEEVEGESGTISGVVKDTTNGEPLFGANVRALNTKFEVTTDAEGNYELELPPGEYTIEFYFDTFNAKEVSLEIVADKGVSQNVELTPMAGMSQTMEIVEEAPKGNESFVNTERKEADTTQDVMSAEEMKKSGGGNVGSVARLIVGATLEDNRYLIVRGLSHRYGNTLFDGARLPSPDPNLRTVPLDIFPSGALSSIKVIKTYSPDQPADYVGFSTQLVSREIPEDFKLDLSVELAANSNATFQQGYRDRSVLGDGVGFGNLKRGFAPGFPTKNPVGGSVVMNGQQVPRYSNEELELLGESIFMETGLNPAVAPPVYSLGATLGDRVYLGRGTTFGWVTSAKLKDGYASKQGGIGNYGCVSSPDDPNPVPAGSRCPDGFIYRVRTDYGIDHPDGQSDTDFRETQLSGIGLFKFDIRDKHNVYGNVFYSRDADSSVRYQQGVSPSSVGPPFLRSTRHRYVMRSILFTQLGAEHEIEEAKGLKIDYFGSFSQAGYHDPGVRDVLYVERPDGRFQVDPSISVPRMQTLELVDNVENGAVNFTMPFKQWKQLDSKFKFGAWVEGKQREFRSRRFNYGVANGLNAAIPFGVQDIIRPSTVGGGSGLGAGGSQPFFLQETTNESDNYFGDQQIFAGYAMMSLPFVRWFELIGGARYEFSEIEVGTFDAFDPDADVDEPANLVDSDFFPSLSFVFKPTEKMNVRLVGSQTIARPEMRELAPFAFIDFAGGTQVQGNPLLNSTKVWNADLRYEFFPSGEEVVAVSAFFKYFDGPIERGLSAGGSNFSATFVNTDRAYNVGGEFEVKKNLGFLGRRSEKDGGGMKENARWLEDFSIGANFAYIWSRVEIARAVNRDTGQPLGPDEGPSSCADGDEKCRLLAQYGAATSSSRPLQGQSPWIANGFIDYDNDVIGTNARVIYNAFGPRIRSIGGLGQSDEYQLQVHTLDLAFSQRLFQVADNTDPFLASTGHELRVTLKVGNILNWKKEWGQYDDQDKFYTTEFFREGIRVALGLNYSF